MGAGWRVGNAQVQGPSLFASAACHVAECLTLSATPLCDCQMVESSMALGERVWRDQARSWVAWSTATRHEPGSCRKHGRRHQLRHRLYSGHTCGGAEVGGVKRSAGPTSRPQRTRHCRRPSTRLHRKPGASTFASIDQNPASPWPGRPGPASAARPGSQWRSPRWPCACSSGSPCGRGAGRMQHYRDVRRPDAAPRPAPRVPAALHRARATATTTLRLPCASPVTCASRGC